MSRKPNKSLDYLNQLSRVIPVVNFSGSTIEEFYRRYRGLSLPQILFPTRKADVADLEFVLENMQMSKEVSINDLFQFMAGVNVEDVV